MYRLTSRKIMGVAAVFMLMGSLTACEKGVGLAKKGAQFLEGGPAVQNNTLPTYDVGEAFTYDDGRTDVVIAKRGDKVIWRTGNGVIQKGYRNFLIPFFEWQNRTSRSRSQITAKPNMLWPLATGKEQSFEVKQTVTSNDGLTSNEFEQSWQCVVEGTEKITVPAGTFDTYRISCFRYIAGTSFWRQTRTYNYAPAIGHYVMREDIYASLPSRRRELVSAGFSSTALNAADQNSLIATFQAAMTNNKDGTGSPWRSAGGKLTAMLTPTRTYQERIQIPLAQGAVNRNRARNNAPQMRFITATCRDYVSAYRVKNRIRQNNRKVCRYPDGRWRRASTTPPSAAPGR
ncbi:MAG TPA: hypothetical protein ENI55_00220 [Alphaproteobacteria bacterium]|nr:hypothetical protein [Alphaproteobacteria bacterium]